MVLFPWWWIEDYAIQRLSPSVTGWLLVHRLKAMTLIWYNPAGKVKNSLILSILHLALPVSIVHVNSGEDYQGSQRVWYFLNGGQRVSICLHDHTLLYVINTETGLPTLEMVMPKQVRIIQWCLPLTFSSFIILSFAQTTQCSMGTSQVTKI